MPSAGDQPGWAPDPERPGMLRWWNGLGWSDARKAPDAMTERARQAATQALRSSTVTPQQVARAAAAARTALPSGQVAAAAGAATNPVGPAAVALGLIGLIVGVFGIVSLIGLIISLQGLLRSRRLAAQGAQRTGLFPSLIGLALSAVGLVRWIPQIIDLVHTVSVQVQQ